VEEVSEVWQVAFNGAFARVRGEPSNALGRSFRAPRGKLVRRSVTPAVDSGTPFFTAPERWAHLSLVETRTFPGGVVLTRYETRRRARFLHAAKDVMRALMAPRA
jgi:hypothetical protein